MGAGLPNGLEHKAWKSEILLSTDTSSQTFVLAGKHLTNVKEVTYLGVSLGSSGVTGSMMIDRMHKAKLAVF